MNSETDLNLKKSVSSIDDVSDEISNDDCEGLKKTDSDSKTKKKSWSGKKKICRICGQDSLSHNFGVVACESCKIFFRRHGTKKVENLTCLKDNKCEINIETRKYCMKCRLWKCLQVGMTFESVASKKKMHAAVSVPDLSQLPGVLEQSSSITNGNYPDVYSNCENGNYREISAHSNTTIGSNGMSTIHNNDVVMTFCIPNDAVPNDFVGETTPAIPTQISGHFGYSNIAIIPASVPDKIFDPSIQRTNCTMIIENEANGGQERKNHWRNDSSDKTEPKKIRCQLENTELPVLSLEAVDLEFTGLHLEELYLANEVWNTKTKSAPPLNGNCAWNITYADFMHVFHHTFTNIIKQHLELSIFHSIKQEDQMILLKGRLIALCKIRFLFKSRGPNDLTDIQYPGAPDGVNMDWSKRVKENSYDQHLVLKNSLPDKFKYNETLMLVLSAIVLFDPSHVELIDKKVVEHGREIYLKLLKRYLESTYGSTEAPTAYKTLLSWLGHLICFIKNCSSGGILELNPRNFEVMTMAAFDFK